MIETIHAFFAQRPHGFEACAAALAADLTAAEDHHGRPAGRLASCTLPASTWKASPALYILEFD
jgi:hypothetical protein